MCLKLHYNELTGSAEIRRIARWKKQCVLVTKAFLPAELPVKAQKQFFWIALRGQALDNITTIKTAARKKNSNYSIKELIRATKKVFFSFNSTNERFEELASLDIFSFEGHYMAEK